ncbi:PP2C family protein-serine/threonine phosphatase [Tabrizicola sp. M-4]|uniref:PP2C family protein-serine/threonine phosphatase n=1 Tax=Tabrizicola sp. M-4 TaxID=3055847 RepID=UPI003DAA2FE3
MTVVSGRQILGARERQEDAFRIIRQDETDPGTDLLILLADGMGGHVGGEVASRIVVEVFEKHCITVSRNPKPADRLVEALEAANAALRERIRREPELAGMGSTLVAAMKLGAKLYWLSVGDSVLYLLRDGQLRRLNADHSVYGELVEHVREGRLTQQEAETHPRRNALRSAIIGDRISLVDCNAIALQKRDVILAASDGLETLDERRILELMTQPDRAEPKAISADLLSAVEAAARPRQDNATVVVYRFDPSAKRAMSTESLFRAGAAAKGPALGRAAIAGGVGVVALALVALIYAIGWGGREEVAPVAAEDAGGVVAGPDAVSAPREPTAIERERPPVVAPEVPGEEAEAGEAEPEADAAPDAEPAAEPEPETPEPPVQGRVIAPPSEGADAGPGPDAAADGAGTDAGNAGSGAAGGATDGGEAAAPEALPLPEGE